MGKKMRSSNIELYRIVMMLVIIAHHLVVNSTITWQYDYSNVTGNMLFLEFFGFGGKPMIDGFLLITGFFTIKSIFTVEKALRVFLEILFYRVLIYFLFVWFGVQSFSWSGFWDASLYVFRAADMSFPATYFWLYCLTPFINTLANALNKRQYLALLGVLLVYFTFVSTVFKDVDTFSELGWYITVYLIGAYLQLHEPRLLNRAWKSGVLTLAALLACFGTILWMNYRRAIGATDLSVYYFFSNAHKPLGLALAVCSFQWFRHLKIRNSRVINTCAASIFGVLLIHANSDTMRKQLWQIWLKIPSWYTKPWLWLYAIGCVFGIFIVCTLLDQIRIHAIEKPFFKLYRHLEEKIMCRFKQQKSI